MGRSLIQTYALAVCFSALMCLVIALGIAVYDVVQIAVPSFTAPEHVMWQSNEHYLTYHPEKKGLSNQEISQLRETHREIALASERRGAMQSLAFTTIIIFIDVVVYAIHWRI